MANGNGNGQGSGDTFTRWLLTITASVLASATISVGAVLWQMNQEISTLQERIAQVLVHSDRRDEAFDRRLAEIEHHLSECCAKR